MTDPVTPAVFFTKLAPYLKTLPAVYKYLSAAVGPVLDEKEFIDLFDSYYSRVYNKYYYANTILATNSLLKHEDIYFPAVLSLSSSSSNDTNYIVDEFPFEMFRENKRILIRDKAGMGKSTLLRRIFLKTIDYIDETYVDAAKIPILIDLRKTEIHNTIKDTILNEVLSDKKNQFAEKLLSLFEAGSFAFLFDGFDEISRAKFESIIAELKDFSEKYHKNHFVITSRDEPILNSLSSFAAFRINGLDRESAIKLIDKYCSCLTFSSDKLLAELKIEHNVAMFELLKNPLMVCLLVVAYALNNKIPLKRVDFYDQVFDALFEKHDLSKNTSFDRTKLSGLGKAEFNGVLRAMAIIGNLKYNNRVEYSLSELSEIIKKSKELTGKEFSEDSFIKDLTSAVPLFLKDGHYYRWVHKSFLEYYAASWLCYDTHKEIEEIKSQIFSDVDKNFNLMTLYYELNDLDLSARVFYPFLNDFVKYVHEHEARKTTDECIQFLKLIFVSKLKILKYGDKENKELNEDKFVAMSKHQIVSILSHKKSPKKNIVQIDWVEKEIRCVAEYDLQRRSIYKLALACKLPIFQSWSKRVNMDDQTLSQCLKSPSELYEVDYDFFEKLDVENKDFILISFHNLMEFSRKEIFVARAHDWIKSIDERITAQRNVKLL